MTTVLGIHVPQEQRIVLASDIQVTYRDLHEKFPTKKLYVSKSKKYVVGMSGIFSDDSRRLLEKLVEEKIDVPKIVSRGHFPDLRKLNHSQMGDKIPDMEKLTCFLIGVRENGTFGLYTCFPLGKIDQRFYTYIGSGSKFVEEYFKSKEVVGNVEGNPVLNENVITTANAIELAINGVTYAANRDLYSAGFDLIIMTPKGINNERSSLADKSFPRRLKNLQKKYTVERKK